MTQRVPRCIKKRVVVDPVDIFIHLRGLIEEPTKWCINCGWIDLADKFSKCVTCESPICDTCSCNSTGAVDEENENLLCCSCGNGLGIEEGEEPYYDNHSKKVKF